MKKYRKMMSLILATVIAVCAFALGACANTKNPTPNETDNNTPTEKSNRVDAFLLGSWVTCYPYTIKSHDAQIKALSEAGLNFSNFPYNYEDNITTYEDWAEVDDICSKYGMYYNLSSYKYNPEAMMTIHNINKLDLDMEIAEKMFADGKGSKYMLGYHLWDEPFYNVLDTTYSWAKMYKDEDPRHSPFVNLNGGSGVEGVDNETYVRKWAQLAKDTVDYIGYDAYPHRTAGTNDTVKFVMMDTYRRVANEYGLRAHSFVQSTGWTNFRMPNAGEIAWDVYGFLAYGFKALSYFNYVTPPLSQGEGFETSIINRDGTIPDLQLYNDVAAMNFKVRAIGDAVINYDCTQVYHTNNKYAHEKTLPDDYFIVPQDDSMVVSYFEPHDKTSAHCIMLYNNDYTAGKTITVNITEGKGLQSLERFNPQTKNYENVDISSGNIQLTFTTGEAILFRIGGNVKK